MTAPVRVPSALAERTYAAVALFALLIAFLILFA